MADRYQVMLDIETLGKTHTAMVLSIGAVVMDMETHTIVDKQYWVCSLPEQKGPRQMDPDTVMWWLEQGEDARAAFRKIVPKTECKEVINELYAFFDKHQTRTGWANGINFDFPIMEDFIRDFDRGSPHFINNEWVYPWNYRLQDMRSLATVMEPIKSYKDFKASREMVAHNALADAECQAEYVLECMKWIKENASRGSTP